MCIYFFNFISHSIRFRYFVSSLIPPVPIVSAFYSERESNTLYAAVTFYNCIHIQYVCAVWLVQFSIHTFTFFRFLLLFYLCRYHIVSHKGSNVLLLLLLLRNYTFAAASFRVYSATVYECVFELLALVYDSTNAIENIPSRSVFFFSRFSLLDLLLCV